MTDKFPFAFDMKAMTEAFQVPSMDKFFEGSMPTMNFEAIQDAQKKNLAAMIEANKVAVNGYQAVYKRQAELFEAAMADAKDRMGTLQGQPMTVEGATENFETVKAAFEKAVTDLKEVTEMAQSASTDAFDIIKARTEEVMAEVKAATEKLAA